MANAASIFRALADPTRREILQELKAGELPAGDISARFDMAAPSVSRHLSILLNAGLVAQRREGNRLYYSVQAERLATALNDFLSAVCPTQLVQRKRRKM
ncbi:MAG: winged helix-turn-helix transcriptional regulator [Planctomycetes bacterium]|nr:winged helix-turn-helix transcriptional regulator [Planctomycetota bacterium]